MTYEQIKQNAEAYILKEYSNVPALTKCAIAGIFVAGAHSRNEEIEELELSLEAAADVVKKLTKQLNELRNPWISIKDQLPPLDTLILEYTSNNTLSIVSYRTEVGLEVLKDPKCTITHWMSIPELQKGGGE